MAYSKNRTETQPDKSGRTLKINDGVSSGFNGDSSPYTVRMISDSGKEVKLSRDQYFVTQAEKDLVAKFGQHEGDMDVTFVSVLLPEEELEVYRLNKHGLWKKKGDTYKPKSSAWALSFGRSVSRNPSF